MWVAYALVFAIVVAAALFDWQARRRGRTHQASRAYWQSVSDARREARAQRFGRRRRFGP